VTFDFSPSAGLEDEYVATRRGSDERLMNITRPNPAERLAAKKARRTHEDDLGVDWADDLDEDRP
jgi:hypothetical protein